MSQKNNRYEFLFEQTTVVPSRELQIIEEGVTSEGKPKIAFQAKLQEANTRNANKRVYSDVVCESIVNILAPKAQGRSLLMEIDHPMFFSGSTDPVQMKRRATIVEIKNCGATIRSINFKNNHVIAEIETLSSFKGPDLANLITKDKIDIGFSLRALGGVRPLQDGTLEVTMPIMPVTYDIVSNPSYSNSRVVEFLPETDMSLLEGSSVMMERNDQVLLENEHIVVCERNYCVRKFIDEIIHECFSEIITKKIKFRI